MIEINNLDYKYKSDKEYIFKNLNLKIENNSFISIIGKNGTGKSTFAKLICGIYSPSSGNILINNIDTKKVKKKNDLINLRKNISIVFQNPENSIIFDRFYDEIYFTLKNLKFSKEKIETNIDKALKTVNMEDFKFKELSNLSMGEKQKLVIAEALSMDSNILVLDEPTTSLDPESKKEILNILYNIKTYLNKTIILITHDINDIFYSDKVLFFNRNNSNVDIKEIQTFDIINSFELLKEINYNNSSFILNLLELLNKNNIHINKEEFIKNQNSFEHLLLNKINNNLKK